MTPLGFIPNDGYTEKSCVAAAPHWYPALRFEHRPATARDRVGYIEAASATKGWGRREIEAAILKRLVISWDMKDAAGVVLPLTEANILRLKPALLDRFWDIVIGNAGSDEDPDGNGAAHVEGNGDDAIQAAREGRLLSEVRRERDSKNLSPG